MISVRVQLPGHLRVLARAPAEVLVDVDGEVTARRVLDALEARYPMLRGTIRDQGTGRRRAYIRYFASGRDISFEPDDQPLPYEVRNGSQAFRILGAISGG